MQNHTYMPEGMLRDMVSPESLQKLYVDDTNNTKKTTRSHGYIKLTDNEKCQTEKSYNGK